MIKNVFPINCCICNKIPETIVVDYQKNETTPDILSTLKEISGSSISKCKQCNAYYMYVTIYGEYSGGRPDERGVSISKIDSGQALRIMELELIQNPMDPLDRKLNEEKEREIKLIKAKFQNNKDG